MYATAAATNAEMLSSPDHPSPPPDISALHRLSQNLESHFNDDSSNRFANAKILVGTEQVAVHRCLLAAQSPFFKNAFSNSKEVELKLKDLAKDHKVGLDALMAVLAYLYSGKVRPLPKGVCVCIDDDCSHEACKPAVWIQKTHKLRISEFKESTKRVQRVKNDIIEWETESELEASKTTVNFRLMRFFFF